MITYSADRPLNSEEFVDVLRRSTLAQRRPVDDLARIQSMIEGADLIVTAFDDQLLVGVSRAISDFAYCTYLSDLAVDQAYQGRGIGRQLVELTHQHAGRGTNLILLAAPAATSYYPHIGMEQHNSCWVARADS